MIDIPQVYNNGAGHQVAQALQVESTELLPLRGNDERVCGFGAIIGICAIDHIFQHRLGLSHAGRVEHSHLSAHVLKSRDQRNGWGLAYIIGVGFERQPKNRDSLATRHPRILPQPYSPLARLLVSFTTATAAMMRKETFSCTATEGCRFNDQKSPEDGLMPSTSRAQ